MFILDATLLTLFLVCACAALMVKEHVAAIIVFGAFSFFSALYFVWLGALDVAFTEAAVGGSLSTIFFLLALHQTRSPKDPRNDNEEKQK